MADPTLDIVRLKNNSGKEFKDQYGSTPYRCPDGDSIIVPFDAACLWFGDPRVFDRPALAQYDRKNEFNRVKVRMGIAVKEAQSDDWEFPNITVETLDGDRVYMAIEDPEGVKASGVLSSRQGLDDRQVIAEELERMKKAQADLLARLNDLQNASAPGLEDVPDDIPTKVPVQQ